MYIRGFFLAKRLSSCKFHSFTLYLDSYTVQFRNSHPKMCMLRNVCVQFVVTKTWNDLKPPKTIYNHLKPPTTTSKNSTTTYNYLQPPQKHNVITLSIAINPDYILQCILSASSRTVRHRFARARRQSRSKNVRIW